MSVEQLIEGAKKERGQKRYNEALELANAAVDKAPQNAGAWWQLALTKYFGLNDLQGASTALQKTVELDPTFAYGWTLYGRTLWRLNQNDKALEVLERALKLDSNDDEALEILADLYEKENDDENQFRVLNQLSLVKDVPPRFFNRLGILHYNRKNYLEAIKYYKRDAARAEDPAPLFNLGLVYSTPEISQDADAVDIWRLAAKRFPGFERSTTELNRVLPRALEFSRQMGWPDASLRKELWFQHYLCPYELLKVEPETKFDDLTPKVLQRLKRAVLQEIELEDGRISWIGGLHIDKSKAIALCDQAYDKHLSKFHWQVFQSWPLLGFLEHGSWDHFLVRQEDSSLEVVESLEDESNGFAQWLSGPFTRQFDLVLAEAIDRRDALALKCILGGRRWVVPEDADKCFESGRRRIDKLLQPLRDAAQSASKTKPTFDNLKTLVAGLTDLLNLLPFYFRDYQNEFCWLLRGISIDCNNLYRDASLAKEISTLANAIRGKSAETAQRLEDDSKRLDELIADEMKHEARLVQGAVRWEITKAGARIGEDFIETNDVTAVRWGITVTGNRSPTHEYLLVISRRHAAPLYYFWQASSELEKNQEHFGKLVGAAVEYLLPSIVARLQKDFDNGQVVQIGPCPADKTGVKITKKGWFSDKICTVPWSRMDTKIENGLLIVADKNDRTIRVEMPLKTTDNAAVLQVLAGKA